MCNYVQSTCVTSASECHLATSMGSETFLKKRKFCEDGFQKNKFTKTKTQTKHIYRATFCACKLQHVAWKKGAKWSNDMVQQQKLVR